MSEVGHESGHVVIAGGGIAGLEAVLALRHLTGSHLRITLVSSEPEFTYLPQLVEEPFTMQPALRRDLRAAMSELDVEFVLGRVAGVDGSGHRLLVDGREPIGYDQLIVCMGGKRTSAYEGVPTLHGAQMGIDSIDSLLRESAASESPRLVLIVPPGVTWSLPIYEFAFMARRRAEELGVRVAIDVYTPEPAPLAVFGVEGSTEVASRLLGRGIRVHNRSRVEAQGNELVIHPGGRHIHAGRALALPNIAGPGVPGLPSDARGFIPTDEFGRVRDEEDVYAAGDGVTFPLKQGGLSCAEADAAVEHIAMRHGLLQDAHPFRPVLRAKLLTGADSLFLRHDVAGGAGEGAASSDPLWHPAIKVGGRYLAAWLNSEGDPVDLNRDGVAVALEEHRPREWHGQPIGLDPL